MRSIVIFALMGLFGEVAFSNTVKLLCHVHTVDESRPTHGGAPEPKISNETMTIEVDNLSGVIFIRSTGSQADFAMTNERGENTSKVVDISDANKWSINRQGGGLESGGFVQESVTIDRNSGSIAYDRLTTFEGGGQMHRSITGTCEKIDLRKRVF